MKSLLNLNTSILFIISFCTVLTVSVSLFSCSGVSTDTDPDNEFTDRISGLYYLSGHKIKTTNTGFVDQTRDSIGVTFTVNIKMIKEKEDSIRFLGLEAVDTGEMEKRVFPKCINPENCRVYGKIIDNEEFIIYITNERRSYQGNGILGNRDIELNARFEDESTTIEYFLTGKQII